MGMKPLNLTMKHKFKNGFTMTMTLPNQIQTRIDGLVTSAIKVEWEPHVPTGRDAEKIADDYRRIRDAFLQKVATRTGNSMIVIG